MRYTVRGIDVVATCKKASWPLRVAVGMTGSTGHCPQGFYYYGNSTTVTLSSNDLWPRTPFVRVIKKFLWKPLCLNNQTRWFGWVYIREENKPYWDVWEVKSWATEAEYIAYYDISKEATK